MDFRYKTASVCYAFLDDVSAMDATTGSQPPATLKHSRWFTRGWTLQELLAPTSVVFYGKEWTHFAHHKENAISIGTRSSLCRSIAEITGISKSILDLSKPFESASVAQRMSWASSRQTSRLEDEAYCLMGLFDVNMPML